MRLNKKFPKNHLRKRLGALLLVTGSLNLVSAQFFLIILTNENRNRSAKLIKNL